MSRERTREEAEEFMQQFRPNPQDLAKNAPAWKPEDLGEDPSTPSATHGDFHARDLEGGA